MKARPPLRLLLLALLLTVPFHGAQALVIVWNGANGDGQFATGGNWVGGNAPANNDFGDTAKFDGGTPTSVNLAASRKIKGIEFSTSGWSLTGSAFSDLTNIVSNGAGTNVMVGIQLFAANTWTIGTGNTLAFNTGQLYQKDKNLTLTGGGTLSLAGQLGGFSGSTGTWGIRVQNATVRFENSATPYSSTAGTIYIDTLNAALELKTTVASATALLGGRVRNSSGGGTDLLVTDIGGGYVRITAVPEPGPAVLLALATLAICVRRRGH